MFHHQSWDSIIVLCFRECLHIGHGLSRLKSTLKTFYDKLTGILTVLVILGYGSRFTFCPNDFYFQVQCWTENMGIFCRIVSILGFFFQIKNELYK